MLTLLRGEICEKIAYVLQGKEAKACRIELRVMFEA